MQIRQDAPFNCVYADATNNMKEDIGACFEVEQAGLCSQDRPAVVLATCQRVEIYQIGHVGVPVGRGSLVFSEPLLGRAECMVRLAEIASGLRSQIIGEKFIYRQVRDAFLNNRTDGALREFARGALRIAQDIRRAYGVVTRIDYDDIVMELLRSHRTSSNKADLIVIGSGMLGQAIAQHSQASEYRHVFVVTRSPKRARKHLEPTVAPIRMAQMTARPCEACDVVIATTGLAPDAQQTVCEFVDRHPDRYVLDVSGKAMSGPINKSPRYTSMYDPGFTSLVRAVNGDIQLPFDDIRATIRRSASLIP